MAKYSRVFAEAYDQTMAALDAGMTEAEIRATVDPAGIGPNDYDGGILAAIHDWKGTHEKRT